MADERPESGMPSGRPDLDELSRRVVSGDERALAELHARLTPGLERHFARKLGSKSRDERAEELAQRTWVALWQALRGGRYDPARARLTTFVYAVSQIVWMRWGREQGRVAGSMEDWSWLGAEPSGGSLGDPAAAVELGSAIEAVRRAMAGEMSEADRLVLEGVARGCSDRELAAELRVSPSTAHERKKSALARLARRLGIRGFGEDSGRAPGEGGA